MTTVFRVANRLRQSRVARGAVWYSVVGILTSGLNLILLPALTRWMSPGEFGIMSTAMVVSQLLMALVTMGLGNAVVRYYYEYGNDEERFARFFSVAFWFQLVMVAVVFLVAVVLLGAGIIRSVAGLGMIHLFPVLLCVVLNPPRDIGNQLLTARQQHERASINQLVSFGVATVISLWLVGTFGLGAIGRLYGLAAGAAVAGLMLFKTPEVFANLRRSWDNSELRHALRFGIPFVPHAMAMAGIAAIDKLVLRHYLSFDEVGIYSAAMAVAMGMSFIFIALARAWYPRFFQLREAGNHAAVLRGQWAILCAMPLMVAGFGILYPVVFPLLVDARYLDGMKLLPVMGFAAYGFGLFATQSSYINFLKKTAWLPIISGSGVVTALVLNLWLVPKFHLAGAAWSTTLAYLVMSAVLLLVVARIESKWIERVLLPALSILLAVAGMAIAESLPDAWLWWPRLAFCAGVTASFAVLWVGGERVLMRRFAFAW